MQGGRERGVSESGITEREMGREVVEHSSGCVETQGDHLAHDDGEEEEGKTLVREDSESKAWSIVRDLDPWTAWLYKPRTITVLLVGACLLVWASGAFQAKEFDADTDTVSNTKAGVWAAIAVFLGYCLLQAPPTILVRPHPSFWRLIHGIAVVYMVFLTFLLFQKREDARRFLKFLHPELGLELKERSYGADCRIYTPENPTNKFANVWVTLNHMLPNFNECWWDSIILDVLICNWIGIWAGMRTVRYFDGKTYVWVGLSRQTSIMGKVKRSLGQFTPAYWDKDEWNPLMGPARFVQVLGLAILILIVEVNAFFLKLCLWIPPRNPLNSYRLLIWWLIANPAIREYNSFLQTRKPTKKLGAFCWLAVAIAIVETLICVKFGRGLYPRPMPDWIFWSWMTAGVGLILFLSVWTYKLYSMKQEAQETSAMHAKKKV
ncbi:hypothetical protein CY35_06G035300 [Sphagnum magellanicum]|nr:hypothetical protein CY35_06G035300 [Sphagnum magellanicum]